ncbi:hypothetical protein DFJ77DRAFT_468847 [Powellomyces hirtus]|nr:hypothetical protein DFJ77DRAFT_468847 [Powellomyces hirtus]
MLEKKAKCSTLIFFSCAATAITSFPYTGSQSYGVPVRELRQNVRKLLLTNFEAYELTVKRQPQRNLLFISICRFMKLRCLCE